jgi:3-dehydroquinate synthase
MTSIDRTIPVSFRHQVHFTDGVFSPANPLLRNLLSGASGGRRARALAVVDWALALAQPALVSAIGIYVAAAPEALELVCPPLQVEGGEKAKSSWAHVTLVHEAIERHRIDRQAYVLAVGGGALLDMVGLAAATAHRGVRLVRLPTTTLSQADSGVGVKNGINAFGKKNFIGAVAPPFAVINDFQFLASLGPRDKRAGYAEAVKVATIRDRGFFEWLECQARALARFELEPMRELVFRCATLHVDHIATGGDPFEMGSARPLDFGHWAAHKLEQMTRFELRHGEAVAVGLALDALYSRNMGWLADADAERLLALLQALGFDLFAPELRQRDARGSAVVLQGLEEFREHLGGELTLTMPRGLGASFEIHEIHTGGVLEAIDALEAWRLRDTVCKP